MDFKETLEGMIKGFAVPLAFISALGGCFGSISNPEGTQWQDIPRRGSNGVAGSYMRTFGEWVVDSRIPGGMAPGRRYFEFVYTCGHREFRIALVDRKTGSAEVSIDARYFEIDFSMYNIEWKPGNRNLRECLINLRKYNDYSPYDPFGAYAEKMFK